MTAAAAGLTGTETAAAPGTASIERSVQREAHIITGVPTEGRDSQKKHPDRQTGTGLNKQ